MNEISYQEKIWQVVALIPEGNVATYGQIAELAGLPRMARAVGRTLSLLPKGTQLPWHRVINAKGQISFPVGSEAYECQKSRLEEEGITLLNGKINLKQHRWQP
ncbi:MGMT family protein [Neptuniibacter sp.]|uniref:MGMT family protein n=1 Tax=Neptuniibacter sp. TaxID=1962643 RepID=UPI0026237E96|nr:MGMT family protein [Neptuniibacter sp.]MCP4598808.1 MGMT family protein [Neptuniibacter sp.]